jgi:NitT/TauT family transport system substrate-binding protein
MRFFEDGQLAMMRFAAILIAVLFFVPCAASAQSAPKLTTIHVGVIPSEVAGEVFYGVDLGLFKKAGLDVEIDMFNNGSAIAAAVASGALDLGLSDMMSVINAHSHGLPFVYAAPGLLTTLRAPTLGLLVPSGSPIRDGKDFDGKSMAVSGLKNIAQIAASAWIDANGGDSKTVKFVEVPFPSIAGALAQGTIDTSVANEPWMTLNVEAGNRLIFMEKGALAPSFLLSGWVTTRDWAQMNPDSLAKFVGAIHDIAVWANANESATAPILSKYTKSPIAVIAHMHRGRFAEAFDPGYVQPVIDAAAKYGVISAGFPASAIIYGAK